MKKKTLIVSILSVLGVLIIGVVIVGIIGYRMQQKYALKHPDAQKIIENLKLGLEYSSQKRFEEAEDAYKKAIELNPDYAPSYYALGICYFGQGKSDEAAEMFRRTLELDPRFKYARSFLKISEEGLLSPEEEKRIIEESEAKIKELEKETTK